MILQIEIKEWIILQDALAGIRMRHSYEEIKALAAKLDKAFNEQCTKPKEDSNGQVTTKVLVKQTMEEILRDIENI